PTRSRCATCNGTGEQPGAKAKTCPTCDGKGREQVVQGPLRMTRTCHTCGGSGKIVPPCPTCGGSGEVASERPITGRVPPGADDGPRLRGPRMGAPGIAGGPPGDLVIETHVRPHALFKRDGLDLHLKLPVTLSEALVGGRVDVPTPDGPVKLTVPPRSQS